MSKESYEAEYTAVAKAFCKKYGYKFIKATPYEIIFDFVGNSSPPVTLGWYELADCLMKETDESDN